MPELTPSTREAARRIGITETALRKAEQASRIAREPDGQWDIDKTRRLVETADPVRSPLVGGGSAGSAGNAGDGTPFTRLKVAQLALKAEAQGLALDETKRRLLDVTEANTALDEIGSTMRDALLNWPARVSGLIAAELGVDPHLLQTILQGAHQRSADGGRRSLRSRRPRRQHQRLRSDRGRAATSVVASARCSGHRRCSRCRNGRSGIAYRMLGSRASAEPGPWRTSRTPYLRDVMDALSAVHPARRVVFMKGAQVGATESGNNWLGYIMPRRARGHVGDRLFAVGSARHAVTAWESVGDATGKPLPLSVLSACRAHGSVGRPPAQQRAGPS